MKTHKRKESFSILLISNTDKSNRQFHISLSFIRIIFLLQLLLIVVTVWLAYQFSINHRESEILHTQLAELEQQIESFDQEKESLNNEINALKAENDNLHQVSKIITSEKEMETESEESEADSSLPSLFPSSEVCVMISRYSPEQPYLSFNANTENSIVATGDGTITAISSNDTYPTIIEVEHKAGYLTRYMCRQSAELQLEEGAQVNAGDILCTIVTDDTQLDYQVLLNNEPIDPFDVIAAKG